MEPPTGVTTAGGLAVDLVELAAGACAVYDHARLLSGAAFVLTHAGAGGSDAAGLPG